MKTPRSLAQAVALYLESRRQLGFALKNEHRALPGLARYARSRGHRGPLTRALAVAWAAQSPSRPQRACRLNMVRRFTRFWQAWDPATETPPSGLFGPGYHRRPVHIYSEQEIGALLHATACLGPAGGLRAVTVRTVLGLLACTGMRISEALHLQRQDVDWLQGCLTLAPGKSAQGRTIVLHPSTVAALRAYARRRDQIHPATASTAFFLCTVGRPLAYSTVRDAFLQLRQHLGWTQPPRPRLHDLRHTFAVRRLLDWSRREQPIGDLILSLSAYLGHRQVTDTYWYFSAIPELLEVVRDRFERGAPPWL